MIDKKKIYASAIVRIIEKIDWIVDFWCVWITISDQCILKYV